MLRAPGKAKAKNPYARPMVPTFLMYKSNTQTVAVSHRSINICCQGIVNRKDFRKLHVGGAMEGVKNPHHFSSKTN